MSDYTPTTDEVRACSLLTQEGPQAVLDVQSPAGGRQEAFRMIHQFTDADLAAHDAEVRAQALAPIREALAGHPRCDIHPDDDPITCGWKRAVFDVQSTLDRAYRIERGE